MKNYSQPNKEELLEIVEKLKKQGNVNMSTDDLFVIAAAVHRRQYDEMFNLSQKGKQLKS